MRIRRSVPIVIAVLLIAAAIALVVTLRKNAPPEAARLLPGADGFLYVNLKWIRTFNATAPRLGTSAYSAVRRKRTSDDRNGESMAARICSNGDLYFGNVSSSVSPKNPERDLTCNPGRVTFTAT